MKDIKKKQDQVVLFPHKSQKSSQLLLIFVNNIVAQSITQKHLGMFGLGTKLDLQEHLKIIFSRQLVYYGSSTTY